MNADSGKKNNEIIERVEQVLQATFESASDFNLAFSGDRPIQIPSLRSTDGYRLEASEILFWVVRNAYFEEFDAWEQSHTQGMHQDAVEQLKLYDQMSVFHDLVSAIERNRIAPFIGAGMCQASGYPLWSAALAELSQKVVGVDTAAFSDILSTFGYLGAVQLLWDSDETQASGWFGKMRQNGLESRNLVTLRDSLLPKLLGRGLRIQNSTGAEISHQPQATAPV